MVLPGSEFRSGLSGFTDGLISMDQRVQSRFGKGLGFRFGYVRMCQGSSLVKLELIRVKFGLGQDGSGFRLA